MQWPGRLTWPRIRPSHPPPRVAAAILFTRRCLCDPDHPGSRAGAPRLGPGLIFGPAPWPSMRLLYVFNAVRQKSYCLYTCTLCTERNLCAAKWIRGFLDSWMLGFLDAWMLGNRGSEDFTPHRHLGSLVSGSSIVACQTGNAILAIHKTCPKSGELQPSLRISALRTRGHYNYPTRVRVLDCLLTRPFIAPSKKDKKFAFARNES